VQSVERRGERVGGFFDQKIGIFTLGLDLATTTVAHNFFGPGVTPISNN
jgi:hypothetical protein